MHAITRPTVFFSYDTICSIILKMIWFSDNIFFLYFESTGDFIQRLNIYFRLILFVYILQVVSQKNHFLEIMCWNECYDKLWNLFLYYRNPFQCVRYTKQYDFIVRSKYRIRKILNRKLSAVHIWRHNILRNFYYPSSNSENTPHNITSVTTSFHNLFVKMVSFLPFAVICSFLNSFHLSVFDSSPIKLIFQCFVLWLTVWFIHTFKSHHLRVWRHIWTVTCGTGHKITFMTTSH